MKLINIILLLMLMSAFSIGVAISDSDKSITDNALNNLTKTIGDSTFIYEDESLDNYLNGFFKIINKYLQFISTFCIEVIKIGIDFGYDNPNYFEPDFIITIMRLIVWALILSLLIKPMGWLLALFIVGAISLKEILNKRNNNGKKITKDNK